MRLLTPLLTLLLSTPTLAALPYKGVDWSSLLIQEAAGKTYKTSSGQIQPLETILKSSGVNTVRQRIWVNPPDGNYNLAYNLKLAKRASAAGLKIYLDFHYSDNWADPGKQVVPAAWSSLSKEALIQQLYTYTKSVLDAFANENLVVELVSIGNEITPGLLFPIGKLGSGEGAKNVAELLKGASRGVRESKLGGKAKVMIHLDNGWDWGLQEWWYDRVLGSGGGLESKDYGTYIIFFSFHFYIHIYEQNRRVLILHRHPSHILLPLLQPIRNTLIPLNLNVQHGKKILQTSHARRNKLAKLLPQPQFCLPVRY